MEHPIPEPSTTADRQSDVELIFNPSDSSGIPVISETSQEIPESLGRLVDSKLDYFLTMCTTVTFISISMAIGILIVYFKSPGRASLTCPLTFRSIAPSLNGFDSRPRSLVLEDINNDGILDVVVANSNTDTIGVFLGYGNQTFSNQIAYSTGLNSGPYSVAVADLNNDKQIDIAVANYAAHNVGIFFGYGNGSFTNQVIYSTGASHPLQLVLGDFNNDSWIDIVVVNFGTNDLGIFLGSTNGLFVLQTTYSTSYDSLPVYMTTADMNHDSRLDLIVANNGTNNIGIFFGYGNGTFASQKVYSTGFGSHPSSITVSNMNNDKQLDIVVTKSGTRQIGIFYGYGNGSFANEITFSTNNFVPAHVAIADINKDNREDIIIVYNWNNSIQVFLGRNDGTFANETIYSTGFGSSPYSVVIGSLNNDDRFDFVVNNIGTNHLDIYIGYNPASFQKPRPYSLDHDFHPVYVTVADFNNDNVMDIIVVNEVSNISVFFGHSDGRFENQQIYSVGFDFSPKSFTIQDLNNDHQLDIAIYDSDSGSVYVFLRNVDGTFQNAMVYLTGFQNSYASIIAIADISNDKQLDLVVVNYQDSKIAVFLGYKNGTFRDSPTRSTYTDQYKYTLGFSLGDLNNDGKPDIAIGNYKEGISILLGYGNGSFGNEKIYLSNLGLGLSSIVLIDLNNDRQLDIVVVYYNSYHAGIWLGHGNGTFRSEILYFLQGKSSPTSVTVGDFNNDYLLDVFVGYSEIGYMSLLLGYGNGSFAPSTMYYTGFIFRSLAVGNFNNDNRLDVVVVNKDRAYINVLLGYDSGAFINQMSYSTGSASHPVAIIAEDFNHDDQLDIVIVNYGTDSISVRLGFGNGTFASENMYSTGLGSLPNSIAKGDFNNDNQLDIVITNAGNDSVSVFLGHGNGSFTMETTYSTGSKSRPTSVIVGNFDNDTWLDIALTNYGTNTIGIFLGYKYSRFITQPMYPTGPTSYPTSVAVGDINNDRKLDLVVANGAAGNIALFLGDGNGYFALQAIYSTGALSYPISIAMGDFNQDNRSDVVVANYGASNIIIFLGFANGTLGDNIIYSTGLNSPPNSVIVGDLNNDNKLDIAIVSPLSQEIGIFLGYGNGNFASQMTYSTDSNFYPTSLVAGDFNKDNQLDIVVIGDAHGKNLGIFLGRGNGTFQFQRTYSTDNDSQFLSLAVGDFNEDNCLDVVVANRMKYRIDIFLGYCNGSLANYTSYSSDDLTFPVRINVGDFNNDGHLDLIVAGGLSLHYVILALGYGDGTFGRETTYPLGSQYDPSCIVVSDFNNDSHLDIAITIRTINGVIVFLGHCCNSFDRQTIIATGSDSQPHSIALGDFNRDNYTDLVVTNEGTDNIGILLGYGNGTFRDQMTFQTGSGSRPFSVAVADLNNDKQLDISVANYANETISVFLGFGNGTFQHDKSYWIGLGSRPYSVSIGDFNSDTYLDIAVSNDGTNNVCILFGYGNGHFGNVTTFTTGYDSQPSSLAVGDFNSDTQMDIAVAMTGTNNIGIISKLC